MLHLRLAQAASGHILLWQKVGVAAVPVRLAAASSVAKKEDSSAVKDAGKGKVKSGVPATFGRVDPLHYVRKFKPLDPPLTDYKENPERDIVNFPHFEGRLFRPNVRLGFIPDSWFNAMYSKTGVTGPYLLGIGTILFMINKEFATSWHMVNLIAQDTLILYVFVRFIWSPATKYCDEFTDRVNYEKKKMVRDGLTALGGTVEKQNYLKSAYDGMAKYMFNAKRELIDFQLEAEYRRRLEEISREVKNRLNYLASVEEAKKRFEQKYMVSWIIDQVRKSITADQEKAIMQQCLADLKLLAAKA